MDSLPIVTETESANIPNLRPSQPAHPPEREILHDLMNHLTVIDLCTFQLRSSVYPSALSTLEHAVENAMIAAKRLVAELRLDTNKRSSRSCSDGFAFLLRRRWQSKFNSNLTICDPGSRPLHIAL